MFKQALQVAAIVMAFATTATAADVAYLNNNAGGKIVLTDTDCSTGGKQIFTHMKGGKSMRGCWFYTEPDDCIRVLWSNGELYQYYLADLTLTEYGKKNYEPKTYY